jgi:hypothetical protein
MALRGIKHRIVTLSSLNYRLDAGASRGGFEAPSCPALSVGCLAAFWSAAAGSPEDTWAKETCAKDIWAKDT